VKHTAIIVGWICFSAYAVWFALRNAPLDSNAPSARAPVTSHRSESPASSVLRVDIFNSNSTESGEAHTVVLDEIMGWIRNQQVLTPEDRDTLLAYVSQSIPQTLVSGEWQERVNEILNFLRSQPDKVPGLSALLRRMVVEDPDPVMRMYALQHMAMWIPEEPVAEDRAAMIALLKDLAETPGDALAGSAVLFLDDLSRNAALAAGEKVADEVIETQALRLADDAKTKPDVRICALQTCAARRMSAAAPAARRIAADASLMIPLRKAAIYTLGELGSMEDRSLLESLVATDPILAEAVKPALNRLHRLHR
jgi:hypothetical protein